MAEPLALQVTMAGDRGGAEVVIETLAAGLPDAGYRVAIAAPVGTPLARAWTDRGWLVLPLPPMPKFRDWRGGRAVSAALHATIRAHGAAVVHTHGTAAQIFGGRAARSLTTPVVWQTHDRFHSQWTVEGLLHRLAARERHDVVVAISEMVARSLDGFVRPGSVITVPNGVDPSPMSPTEDLPERTAARGPVIVWCGRLQHWKGVHVFLDVAAEVRRQCPTAMFAIVGGTVFGLEPDYPGALRAQAQRLGLAESVRWVGQVPDARPWLAAADLVVHSAVAPEPFGLVVAEAMMQAVPVVAFAQGGPAEMIVDGHTGLLVSPGDRAAMAAAIVGLVRDPVRRTAMGTAARHRAQAKFSSSEMVRGIKTAYDRARAIV